MVPWKTLFKPIMAYSVFNLIKTMLGSALVGYGIATLRDKSHDKDDDDGKSFFDKRMERYIKCSVTIGVGIWLALPSLASQMLWESAIPALTATETAQGYATESMYSYFDKWKPKEWRGGGSGKGGGEGKQREK